MQSRNRVLSLVFVSFLVLAGCASRAPMGAQKSLYERLGGQASVTAVVDDFIGTVAADSRINARFAGTNIPRLKRLLVEQISAGTGGPVKYTGEDMLSAHKGMRISEAEFSALVEDLIQTLDKFNVPVQEKRELLAILVPMKRDIVGK